MTGDQISYSVAVHNDGPDAAAAVSVTDSLPAELELVSATGDGWTCSSAGASITCTRAQLATGATSTVTIVVAAIRGGTDREQRHGHRGHGGSRDIEQRRLCDRAHRAPRRPRREQDGVCADLRRRQADRFHRRRSKQRSRRCGGRTRSRPRSDGAGRLQMDVLGGARRVRRSLGRGIGGAGREHPRRRTRRLQAHRCGSAREPPTITNRVTAAAPADAIDTDLSNNAATARVRMGLAPTTLRVTITPGVATVTSGEPKRFVIRTSNTGNAAARGVVTCVSIPRGASVARATGGFVVAGRYCWQAPSLAAGKTVQYVIHVVGDRRQTRVVVLGVRAEARNAPGVRAAARVDVLTAVSSTAGGYTG